MTEVPLKKEVLLLAHSWRGRSQLILTGKAWQQGTCGYGLAFIVREQRELSYLPIPPLADGLVSLPCREGHPSSVSLRWK